VEALPVLISFNPLISSRAIELISSPYPSPLQECLDLGAFGMRNLPKSPKPPRPSQPSPSLPSPLPSPRPNEVIDHEDDSKNSKAQRSSNRTAVFIMYLFLASLLLCAFLGYKHVRRTEALFHLRADSKQPVAGAGEGAGIAAAVRAGAGAAAGAAAGAGAGAATGAAGAGAGAATGAAGAGAAAEKGGSTSSAEGGLRST
jgi:hypothetical protein